uniref:Uncharacterized protein n=1 Tax=viral metagenome TaxID=1070528 RepID=A0A6C0BJP7_9ZZZZ
MSTPEEKLVQIETTLKNLENNLMKLNDEYDAKKAEIDAITNIKNNRLKVTNFRGESIKEKKAFGQKFLGIFGKDAANTARRLTDAKAKLQQIAYGNFMIKVDQIKSQYQTFQNMKDKIEFEIQEGQKRIEKQARNVKNKEEKNKIEKQKSDLITRYTKLGYTYVPETTQYQNPCAGMPQQAYEYMDCTSKAVKVPYTDSFQYVTETREKPTDGNWKEEQQTITIPAKYEQRVIPGTQGSFGYQGYGSNSSSETVLKEEAREEVVSVWKRDLPAGFPAKVEYNDFPTKIIELESKSNSKNVQSRKRKQNRRKSMKARKN